ncbi:MAG: ethanolamine ammonia-lyase subunit EutC [Bacteroidales bacterium]|nr:ethanolamine ammonia-lyase subunit EutC [Bacteroidales bacterium]
MSKKLKTDIKNPWDSLKEYTEARIAIGRCGSSIPTEELLDFRLLHAKAIDSVHTPLDCVSITSEIESLIGEKIHLVHSAAQSRSEYLSRPDLGRRLSDKSIQLLTQLTKQSSYDVALIVADGLSSHAIHRNIAPLFRVLMPALRSMGLTLAPSTLVEQGRVAIADEIASILNAKLSIIFIGERPGLKTPDSLGVYLTYDPVSGTTDERRNCISNIRSGGLAYELACSKLLYLIQESFKKRVSGIDLKDEQDIVLGSKTNALNF